MILSKQIVAAANKYALAEAKTDGEKDRLRAAVLSGVSLTARYLTATDGETTPQDIERAVAEAGAELGFETGKL